MNFGVSQRVRKCRSVRFLSRLHAFTLIEILIVVGIISLVTAIAIPNFLKTRVVARTQVCIENLAQIESAKNIWGVKNSKKSGDPVAESDLIGPALYIRKMPACPAGGTYDFGVVGTPPTCTEAGHSL